MAKYLNLERPKVGLSKQTLMKSRYRSIDRQNRKKPVEKQREIEKLNLHLNGFLK